MSRFIKGLIISVFILLTSIIVILGYNIINKSTIYNGVSIDGFQVGGLRTEETKVYLEDMLKEGISNRKLIFTDGTYLKEVSYKELGVDYNYEKAVRDAYSIGREKNIFSRIKEILIVTVKGEDIKITLNKDKNKILNLVEQLNKDILLDKKDATIEYENGELVLVKEVIGRKVNKEKLINDIEKNLLFAELIEIPIIEDKPKVTEEILSRIKDELGSYSTRFGLNDSNRVHNVKLASKAINNRILLPGEEFSFNKSTGPRSKNAGYKEATVILNGKFVPGQGGGVCQVSSTLYNTVLASNLKVLERHPHSLPVGYVPTGRDATVAYDILDLRFENNLKAPLYIKSDVIGNQLIVKIFGSRSS